MDGQAGGWLRDKEDFERLRALPKCPTEFLLSAMGDVPKAVDPRPWLQMENQGNMSSCQGHALSTCVELAYFYESGKPIQFSRMFAYIMSQRKDGIRGDNGSTIAGGEKTARNDGLPLETTMPYTGKYSTSIPQAAIDEAKHYKINTSVHCQSYRDILTFLQSGCGGIDIGIDWTCQDAAVQESYRGGRGGGHALGLVGYTERLDRAKDPYIIMANSWGTKWGANGFTELSPLCVSQMLESSHTVAIGLSDMVELVPRKIKHVFI